MKKLSYFLSALVAVALLATGCKPQNGPDNPDKPHLGDTELNSDSPVGTIGMLDGREAIVVDLGGNFGKVAIATMNVGATDPIKGQGDITPQECYGDHFSQDEALSNAQNGAWGTGWYVPSHDEMQAVSEHLTSYSSDDYDDELEAFCILKWQVTQNAALYFPFAGYGYNDDPIQYMGYQAYYCTSTKNDDDNMFSVLNVGRSDTPNKAHVAFTLVQYTAKVSVRLFHKLPAPIPQIYPNSPVGTIGMLDGRQAIVVDLGGNIGRVAIATMNVGATDPIKGQGDITPQECYGDHFSQDEALSNAQNGAWGTGWYVPSHDEMQAVSEHLTSYSNDDYDDELEAFCILKWQVTQNAALYFPFAGYGYNDDPIQYMGYQAYYCTSTKNNDDNMFSVLNVGRSDTPNKAHVAFTLVQYTAKVSVRLFHKMDICSNDPVGTVGQLDGKEGIVVDLGGNIGKKVIAMFNYGSSESKKDLNYYYWQWGERLAFGSLDDANQNGWYVPSKEELEALAGHLSTDWGSEDGEFYYGARWNVDGTHTLYIPALGCMSWNNTHLMENTGVYMSRTEESEALGTSWFLRFSEGGNAYVSTLYHDDRYYVRQFHDMPK